MIDESDTLVELPDDPAIFLSLMDLPEKRACERSQEAIETQEVQ